MDNFIIKNMRWFDANIGIEYVDQVCMILENLLASGWEPKLQSMRDGEPHRRFSVPIVDGIHVDFYLVRYVPGLYVIKFVELVEENNNNKQEEQQ